MYPIEVCNLLEKVNLLHIPRKGLLNCYKLQWWPKECLFLWFSLQTCFATFGIFCQVFNELRRIERFSEVLCYYSHTQRSCNFAVANSESNFFLNCCGRTYWHFMFPQVSSQNFRCRTPLFFSKQLRKM